MITWSDALTAYRICARAEGKSHRTIEWIACSVKYFSAFLGDNQDISAITADESLIFPLLYRVVAENQRFATEQL